MRVLIATAMYPTPARPAFGSFVRTQVEALERAGVEVELLVLDGKRRKLIYPKGMFQLRRRLARGSIDLVHAHYGYVGFVARTQWRLPVVVTYHGDDLLGTVDERGRITAFSRLVVAAGRALSEVVDAVIVQSEEMAASIRRPDAHIIPHEVDLNVFRPTERERARRLLGLDTGKRYLLFASPPDIAVKRFPLARAAADLLAASDPTIELLTVHQETQDRLALYLSACDALVFPSYQEGSPNIVKQAMACNLPVVATNVGDVRDVIGETPGCFVCEPDAGAFAARLGEILAHRERTTGRERVRHLDADRVSARVVGVYERVLEARARGPFRGLAGVRRS
jgi:glycosyltransferase involved in cell wall biosynthesis